MARNPAASSSAPPMITVPSRQWYWVMRTIPTATTARIRPKLSWGRRLVHWVTVYPARSAASTTLASNIALVIGPTPPGTGAR